MRRSKIVPSSPIHDESLDLLEAVQAARRDARFIEQVRGLLDEAQDSVTHAVSTCEACGKCCMFEQAGHRLYCSTGELAIITSGPLCQWQEGRCAFLRANRCHNRSDRPLGCRMYFCKVQNEPLYEKFHAWVRWLHQHHGVPYFYVEMTRAAKALGGA